MSSNCFRWGSCALALLLAATATQATPLTPAFTYQGKLMDGGEPANGLYDFIFDLMNAPTGGEEVGGTQTAFNTLVTDGLFTVTLNSFGQFGPDAFNGEARWLAIHVRRQGSGPAFETLDPRQPIMPAPYAHKVPGVDGHSLDAADGSAANVVYVDNAGNVGVGTTTPEERLSVAGNVRLSDDSSIFGLDELVGYNDLKLFGDDNDGPDILITPEGHVGIGTPTPNMPLTIAPQNGGVDWLQFRDAAGQDKFHFTYQGGFSLSETGVADGCLFVAPGGNVGIGNVLPVQKLDVDGGMRVMGGIIQSWGPLVAGTTDLGLYSSNPNAWIRHVTRGGNTAFYTDGTVENSFAGTTPNMMIQVGGAVGVGTDTPVTRLHVYGPGSAFGNHVALFENAQSDNADGIAIKVSKFDVNRDNNFVTFYNSTNQVLGRIEGFDRENGDFDPPLDPSNPGFGFTPPSFSVSWSDPNDFPWISYPTGFTFDPGGITTPTTEQINDVTCWTIDNGFMGLLNILDPVGVILAGSTIAAVEACNDGGVVYGSKGADYAEWLPKLDPNQKFYSGQIVGVFGGHVSLATEGADQIMVISSSPVVLGNQPEEGREHEYVAVAFVGQAPVRVRGECRTGDFLIPSGFEDGTAIAVSPSDIAAGELRYVLGRAWSGASSAALSMVNAAVGVSATDASSVLDQYQRKLDQQTGEMAALRRQFEQSERSLADLSQRLEQLEASRLGPVPVGAVD